MEITKSFYDLWHILSARNNCNVYRHKRLHPSIIRLSITEIFFEFQLLEIMVEEPNTYKVSKS